MNNLKQALAIFSGVLLWIGVPAHAEEANPKDIVIVLYGIMNKPFVMDKVVSPLVWSPETAQQTVFFLKNGTFQR